MQAAIGPTPMANARVGQKNLSPAAGRAGAPARGRRTSSERSGRSAALSGRWRSHLPLRRDLPRTRQGRRPTRVENVWQLMRRNWHSNRVFTPTTTSSPTVARHKTSSPTSPGASCPSASETGRNRS